MDIGYFLKLMTEKTRRTCPHHGAPVYIKVEGSSSPSAIPAAGGMVKKIAYSLMDEAMPQF